MAGAQRGEPGTALRVEGLCKSFGDLEVLRGVSLAARERDVIAILGASGSGKSTLLRCINLLEVPDAGRGPRRRRADPHEGRPARPGDAGRPAPG